MDQLPEIYSFERRLDELNAQMAEPSFYANPRRAADVTREQQRLRQLVDNYRAHERAVAEVTEHTALCKDAAADEELRGLAQLELPELERKRLALHKTVLEAMIPPEPSDSRNTVMEIRAGTGGDEAGLFAADMHRMYVRYAEARGWKVQPMSSSVSDRGGYKEVIFLITGDQVYKQLKYESGVHRVQRIPVTEANGRVHTSTVTVAEAARDYGAFTFLRVLHHRNYRLFFTGQFISLMGTWITSVTQGYLVYSLTHSPLLLGVVAFAGQAPVFFFSAFGGMISDRFDRRHLLLWTQSLACAQSLVLAVLTLTHLIQVWMVVCLALFQGLINAFDVPIRQAMTVEMVGRTDLRHAISLNSMMFNLARVVGPPVAGILIALVGVGICFALDALSYLAVIFCLTLMAFSPRPYRKHAAPLRAIAQGFAYAWTTREIRISLFLVASCSAFGASYLTQLPAFARDVLHQGSEGLGFLYGAVGAGALMGAYALARVPDRHLLATPVAAALGFGVAVIAFSQSHIYWLSMALLMPCAFNLMLLGGSTNSIIQLASRDDMRGRVVSLYAMCFLGMMPWGSLLLGWAAESFGLGIGVAIGGVICILAAGAAWSARRETGWELKAAE